MEEDIKIIEKIIYNDEGKKMSYVDVNYAEGEEFVNAIENLIQRFKVLKAEYPNTMIPKSKIKEIIQENSINISGFWCIPTDDLQELLD